MAKFSIFNEHGLPIGHWDTDIHTTGQIPAEAIEITYAQWQELVTHDGFRRFIDGEVIPYEPPPQPQDPIVVSASQAKIALYNAGLLEQVKTLVGAHPYEPVRIWYADANQWERGHVYVQALGAELGLTEDDIDALFQAASLL